METLPSFRFTLHQLACVLQLEVTCISSANPKCALLSLLEAAELAALLSHLSLVVHNSIFAPSEMSTDVVDSFKFKWATADQLQCGETCKGGVTVWHRGADCWNVCTDICLTPS